MYSSSPLWIFGLGRSMPTTNWQYRQWDDPVIIQIWTHECFPQPWLPQQLQSEWDGHLLTPGLLWQDASWFMGKFCSWKRHAMESAQEGTWTMMLRQCHCLLSRIFLAWWILETANASLNISRQLVVTQSSQQGHLHLSSSPYTNPAIQIESSVFLGKGSSLKVRHVHG